MRGLEIFSIGSSPALQLRRRHNIGPPAVEVPGGPAADAAAAWQGERAYDPAGITVPTLLVRGEWDSLCDDTDACRLFAGLGARETHELVIPKATHLMHREKGRFALWKSVTEFFKGSFEREDK